MYFVKSGVYGLFVGVLDSDERAVNDVLVVIFLHEDVIVIACHWQFLVFFHR